MSFNNLSSHIPLGIQLQASDDKSIYNGNDGLHGPPIDSCLENETSSEGHEQIGDKINDQPEAYWFFYGLIIELWLDS